MNEKHKIIIGVVILAMVMYGITIILFNNKIEDCDTLIEMEDSTFYQTGYYFSGENGMTRITLCNGEKIQVPTNNIKVIKPY